METIGVPLKDWDVSISYGIKTGYNDAFIIDHVTRSAILANCSTEDERERTDELIRPILRGRDIKRYSYEWAHLYIIATFPAKHIDIEQYPAVKAYLLSYGRTRLEQTGKTHIVDGEKVKSRKKTQNKWFETQDQISYWNDFSKPKIVWGEISDKSNFVLDKDNHYFVNNKCYLMVGDHLPFLTCYLNSGLAEYLFSNIATTTGVGTVQWSKFTIQQLLIPTVSPENEELIEGLLKNDVGADAIDNTIYNLCRLNDEEQAFIRKR